MYLFFAQSPLDSLQNTLTDTGFDWPHVISQAIAFIILALLLAKFAYKPVSDVLEQRRRVIIESLANADRIKKQLAEAETERLAILKKANERATALIAEAHQAAQAVAARRNAEATHEGEEIIRQARAAAVSERDRLLAELRREIGALVVQTTSKVVGRVLTHDDENRLSAETFQQLNAQQN